MLSYLTTISQAIILTAIRQTSWPTAKGAVPPHKLYVKFVHCACPPRRRLLRMEAESPCRQLRFEWNEHATLEAPHHGRCQTNIGAARRRGFRFGLRRCRHVARRL